MKRLIVDGTPIPMPPVYQRIARALRSRIFHGLYRRGAAIPSENQLSREFGVTRLTVRQALSELREEGVLESRRGSGNFVTERQEILRPMSFVGYVEDLVMQSLTLDTRVAAVSMVAASQRVGEKLALAPKAKILRVERIRHADGHPVIRAENFLSARVAAKLSLNDLRETSLIELLEEQAGIVTTHATQTFSAVSADASTAAALQLELGTALLFSELLSFSGDTPINYSRVHYRPDRVLFTAVLASIRTDASPRIKGSVTGRIGRASEKLRRGA